MAKTLNDMINSSGVMVILWLFVIVAVVLSVIAIIDVGRASKVDAVIRTDESVQASLRRIFGSDSVVQRFAARAPSYEAVKYVQSGHVDINAAVTEWADGDRVLLRNQNTSTENGLYTVVDGYLRRPSDFESDSQIKPGSLVYCTSTSTLYVLTSDGPYSNRYAITASSTFTPIATA